MDILELLTIVNDGLAKGKSLTVISKDLGYKDESSIRKKLNKSGYKRDGNKFIYTENKNVVKEINVDSVFEPKMPPSSDSTLLEDIKLIEAEIKDIKGDLEKLNEVYTFYQEQKKLTYSKDNKIAFRNFDSKILTKTYKVYESVAKDFKKLCDKNSQYKVQDIVSIALAEFVERHK